MVEIRDSTNYDFRFSIFDEFRNAIFHSRHYSTNIELQFSIIHFRFSNYNSRPSVFKLRFSTLDSRFSIFDGYRITIFGHPFSILKLQLSTVGFQITILDCRPSIFESRRISNYDFRPSFLVSRITTQQTL